jgi:protein gp37
MSKMFTYNGKRLTTWNPQTGCAFSCLYCWSCPLAETRLKAHYPNGFIPAFHTDRLKRKFKEGEFCFISSMGDISFCKPDDLKQILDIVENNPQTDFLFCTKNPMIYRKKIFKDDLSNAYYGATIETNRSYPQDISKAPINLLRYSAMVGLKNCRKFISIEPVMDFDLEDFTDWILTIEPEIVEIGADNYRHSLPEPEWYKVSALIDKLELAGIQVIQKEGLERLRE